MGRIGNDKLPFYDFVISYVSLVMRMKSFKIGTLEGIVT